MKLIFFILFFPLVVHAISPKQIAKNNCMFQFNKYGIKILHYKKSKIQSVMIATRYNYDVVSNKIVWNKSHTYSVFVIGRYFLKAWSDSVTIKCWAYPSGRLSKYNIYQKIF